MFCRYSRCPLSGGFTLEDKETVVAADSQTDESIRIILQKDIEFRRLPPIDVLRFAGNLSKWPELIDSIKTRAHMKVTFNDSMRMERLQSFYMVM